ncbi:Hypp6807 [Branchiostoma lanceolatum]|uniref:Hypp6807 protein n=1 Tax=Branchiostoma lanceolatum TaxID=7740 RepID=A0A8J9YVK1_BRALA|nr:Hypp6807 [Branchiostoma lanceolatum]
MDAKAEARGLTAPRIRVILATRRLLQEQRQEFAALVHASTYAEDTQESTKESAHVVSADVQGPHGEQTVEANGDDRTLGSWPTPCLSRPSFYGCVLTTPEPFKTTYGVTTQRWSVIMKRYSHIRHLIESSDSLMSQTTVKLFDNNHTLTLTVRGHIERWLSTREICGAAEKIAGYETMEGAQLVGGLWRLYAKSRAAQTALLAEGLTLRGRKIPLYDHNPFIVDGQGENTTPTTRVTIKGIPLSADDRDIVKSLERFGCKLRSAVMYEKDRDEDKKLTRWENGNRFVFIEIPAEPLPVKLTFGNFRGIVKHRERHYRKPEDMTCGKCLLEGHYSKICPNDIVCRDCGLSGHKRGDPDCQFLAPEHQNAEITSPSAEDVIEQSFRMYVEKEPAAETSPGTSGNNDGCMPKYGAIKIVRRWMKF